MHLAIVLLLFDVVLKYSSVQPKGYMFPKTACAVNQALYFHDYEVSCDGVVLVSASWKQVMYGIAALSHKNSTCQCGA